MNKWLMKLVNSFGFTVALLVEIAIMSVSMWLLGYQVVVSIGFVLIGLVVVLFAVRAWVKGNKALWFMFACVSIFFSWSFALVGTSVQVEASEATVSIQDDETLRTIREQLKEARETRESLSRAFDESGREGTIDSVLRQQEDNNERIAELERQERNRLNDLESGSVTKRARTQAAVITSEKIFSAIPDTVKDKDWIKLIIFGLIFIGLEITIVAAVEEERQDLNYPENPNSLSNPEIPDMSTNEPDIAKQGNLSAIIDDLPTTNGDKVDLPDIKGLSDIGIGNIISMLTSDPEYPKKMLNPVEAHEKFLQKHGENEKIPAYSQSDIQSVQRWIYANGLNGKDSEEIISKAIGGLK